jgi:hypothetical protein
MSIASRMHQAYQEDNPEPQFNSDLLRWRESDDAMGYLEDVFAALEVVPGITFNGVTIERDESRFPADLTYNDVEVSRMDLAQVSFNLKMGEDEKDVVLSIFLPKLVDGLFYVLNGSLYYPILQLVDRGTYVTRKTLTLKTLLMPLVFRRDTPAALADAGSALDRSEAEQRTELVLTLDLFRSKINVFKYILASKGLQGTLEFMGVSEEVSLAARDDLAAAVAEDGPGFWRAYDVKGPAGVCVAAKSSWVEEDPHFRGAVLATLADALDGAQRRAIEEDDLQQWRRRLGRHFTQNSNGFEEKADKILVSLERILDRRTRKNLAHVAAADKEDVYCILRWMMREFRQLCQVDGMDVRNKRIRVSEYLIHPLLLRFSESTYRLLNSKNLTFRSLLGVFRQFVSEADGRARPQAFFLIKRLTTNDLLRYVNMVNSFDAITALRFTTRGPQSMGDRGRGDIALRYRGHHPSYLGRISLSAASASDPGTSGTLVPFCQISGQFFL